MKIIRESDDKHPVDNYNLLKRTAITWRKISRSISNSEVKFIIENHEGYLPNWEECRRIVALGLLYIQYYYDNNPQHIIKGIVYIQEYIYILMLNLQICLGNVA